MPNPARRVIDPANRREGARVRHWRVSRNVALREFADQLGVSKSALSRIEIGLQALKPAERERLLVLLDVTVAQFYEPEVKVDEDEAAKGSGVAA